MRQLVPNVNLLWLLVVSFPAFVSAEQNSKSYMGALCIIAAFIVFFVGFSILYYSRWYGTGYLGAPTNYHQDAKVVCGLDEAEVESLPSLQFSKIKIRFVGLRELECTVCLNEFKDKDVLRVLPHCFHVFHPHCIAPWLASNATCPVCRASVVGWRGSPVGETTVLEKVLRAIPEDAQHYPSNEHHIVDIKEGSSTTSSVQLPKEICPRSNYREPSKANSSSWGTCLSRAQGTLCN